MNTDKLYARQQRMTRLKEWADGEDGLFAIFAAVERDYLKTIAATDINETALREMVYQRVKALNDVKRAMEVVIADGMSARAIIDSLGAADKPKPKKKGRNFA